MTPALQEEYMERSLTHIALFAALIAVLGLVPQITLAVGVPITAQSLGIMLCGTVLGARRGALAVVLFLVLVAAGLPLLSGGRGGLGVFAGPSAGFLVGFPVAAFVCGLIVERWRMAIGPAAFVGAVMGGIVVLYAFGIPVLAARLTEGVDGPSADPLRPASRSTSPSRGGGITAPIAPMRGSCRRSRLRGRCGGSEL